MAAQIVLPPQAFLTIIWELFLKFFRIFIYVRTKWAGGGRGRGCIDNCWQWLHLCAKRQALTSIRKKERNQDDGTNSQNSVLQINIAHIWRGWLGSVDGSMWNVLVEAFINVMCPLSGPQCAECVQLQIFWQKIAVQPTIHAMSMWLHLQRLRNLDGRSWGFVGGFLWVMIAHSSDNPEVQERFSTISY